ncbi:MAG: HD domain-containing protein, partial [Blastocatellia bacterium]|nr:HD domain-containing protein [Blastocatellia bacterium]
KTREEIITKLADRIDSYKKYNRPHSRLTAELAARLARRFGLAQSDVHAIAEAALLLDIGLYVMMPAYNASPGPLGFEERLDLWRHSIIGEQQMAKREASRQAQLLVRWHHEWWNGSGYPDMLAFEDIPIGARILRAVELYSALISDRPYRAALSSDESLEALRSSAGIECDPFVVGALLALIDELQAQATETGEETRAPALTQPPPAASPPDEKSFPSDEKSLPSDEKSLPSDEKSLPSDEKSLPFAEHGSLSPHPEPLFESESPAPPEQYAEFEQTRDQEIEPNRDRAAEPGEQPAEDQTQWPVADSSELVKVEEQLERFIRQQGDETPAIAREEPDEKSLPFEAQADTETPERISSEEPSPEPHGEETGDTDVTDSQNRPTPQAVSSPPPQPVLPPIEQLLARARAKNKVEAETEIWNGWSRSRYNRKSLLGFEVSVLRQVEFRSIAVAFSGWARMDWYMKAWGKLILSNDPRPWAAAVARAMIESKTWLDEDHVSELLEDVYVPGIRLANERLRRWFGETDAWWLDNLRRNIALMEDETLRAQALVLGMQTGDYALSFDENTRDLKRPLTTVFWRLAGRAFGGPPGHPHNRSYNLPAEEFVRQTRADLLYINLPSAHAELAGSEARHEWRDCWVKGVDEPDRYQLDIAAVPQSKHSYLAMLDRLLREAAHIGAWAIEYQEAGLASARDISDLIKEHRAVRATYSKDLTELAGGLRNYIIVAERTPSRSAFGG